MIQRMLQSLFYRRVTYHNVNSHIVLTKHWSNKLTEMRVSSHDRSGFFECIELSPLYIAEKINCTLKNSIAKKLFPPDFNELPFFASVKS